MLPTCIDSVYREGSDLGLHAGYKNGPNPITEKSEERLEKITAAKLINLT